MAQSPSVLQKLSHMYPQMSPSQQAIADVILRDPESSAFYNVAEMAKEANVSESTVTRFATFLGCSGFPGLSRELQEMVRSRLTTGQRFQLSRSITKEEQTVMQHFEEDVHNLNLMIERIDLQALERVVKLLLAAKRIGIVSSRSTLALGTFFDFYLNLLHKDTLLFSGEPRTVDRLHRLQADDVIVGIGFARYTRFSVDCLAIGKQRGAKIVVITDYPSSPLCQYADEVLYTPTGIASHMESFVAPMSLLTAILRSMFHQDSEKATRLLTEMEDAWSGLGIYFDPNKS
ncbi:MurR/RpiR family transcriptional regulator [Brevibacillus centrosporus]|uniref:MurR/RpiR family transcriptional regulator n=1 Tax=Brevibacillus centrosporus TaxID=54910 RepID=UPI000F09DB4A|nr:MurR/RpiR family transcriptional regulator [Brevibacillus centrosporus]MEC2129926.1 MurR/RpiR family transcriptional regulator [Brevibacillus centrosporus]MED4907220.1 MurR/RpiR family transcriptional regulator [Brevibacillus centrosporus]RNB71859.1 MurR/RpiR family transcriptional regulator [Brevibacillus centrosporus]GED32495.1 RpiR family transcriptional regulator [Brevibacillus centrosporus]